MNIYTMNLSKMGDEAFNTTSYKPTEITNPTAFLEQAMVIFSHIHPVRNEDGLISMDLTMKALPDTITTPNGTITKENIRGLVLVVHCTNRSTFIKNMGKDSTLGSLTPIFLYAFKRYNEIGYEEWDKEDSMIQYALGKFLAEVMFRTPTEPLTLSADEVRNLRETALTYQSGKKAGEVEKATAFKMAKLLTVGVTDIHKPLSYLLLQTWIANPEIRKPNIMILDPWDWDNVPKALDVVVDKPKVAPTDPGRKRSVPWS